MSSSTLTEHDRELLRTQFVPQIEDLLRDVEALETVEEVERLASELLLPFQVADAPAEFGRTLVDAVASSGAPVAEDLLAAFSVLGRGEVAAAAEERRAGASRFEGQIGRLEPRSAARVVDGAAEVL